MSLNLKTENFEKEQEKIKFGKALPLVVVIFILLLSAYAALIFLRKDVEAKITSEQEEYSQKLLEFKNGNAKEVLDFQNRISESRDLFGKYFDGLGVLGEIEKNMVPGVYLDSLSLDSGGGVVELTCLAGSFDQVAKQILSFKKSEFFLNVESGESDILEQEGRISFLVKLTLKQKKEN
ncbi:MAG: PilN domain-containing protein [Patescibacteria group bacterium]